MRREGFTLIEILVIFVIVGILVTVAMPGFSNLLPNYRLRNALRDLYSNFQLAKMTAVRKNSNCAVTFNQDIGGITYSYVVYVDSNGSLQYDAGEELLTKVLFSERYPAVGFDTSQGAGDGITFDDHPNNTTGLPSIAFLSNGLTQDLVSGAAFLNNTKNRTGSVAVSVAGNIIVQ